MDRTLEELSRIGEEDAVVFNFDQVQAVAGYYMNQESWLYGNEPESLIKEMFPDIHGIQDMEGIRQKLQEGQRVWFIGSADPGGYSEGMGQRGYPFGGNGGQLPAGALLV